MLFYSSSANAVITEGRKSATIAVRGALVGKEVGRRGVQVSCSEGSERTGGITDMEQREGYGG